MDNSDLPSSNALNSLLPKIMRFARLLQGIANRFTGVAGWLAGTGLTSALLLDGLAAHRWQLSIITTLILGAILILPGLVLGWTWYVLDQAGTLPQRLSTWAGQAFNYAGDVLQRQAADAAPSSPGVRMADLKKVGGLAYEITSMGLDTGDLLAILGSSLSIANPLFLLALTVSVGLIVLLDLSALIAGLVALLG